MYPEPVTMHDNCNKQLNRGVLWTGRITYYRASVGVSGCFLVCCLSSAALAQVSELEMTDPQDDIPAQFSEAPMLAKLVAEGKLPPVEQRLPKDVEIVTPVEGIGEYGGTWREVHSVPDMGSLKMVLAYELPIRWKADYTGYEPGLAKSIIWSKDGKIITFQVVAPSRMLS